MDRLDTLFVSLSSFLNKIGAYVVLPLMTMMMTADVMLRYVFNAPLSWGLEASTSLLLILFVLGMVEAFRNGAHIRMDLLYRTLPAGARRAVTLGYGALAIAVFAALSYKSGEEAAFQRGINQVTQYLHIPEWLFSALVSGVTALIVAFFILRMVALLRGARSVVEDIDTDEGHH